MPPKPLWTSTGAELAIGGGVLTKALALISDPEAPYADGSDAIRRTINETLYQRFYLDENGVQTGDLDPPFENFHAALAATREKATAIGVKPMRRPTTNKAPSREASELAQTGRSLFCIRSCSC
jgi:hypothetical protein